MSSARRVVLTGLGLVTPCGIGGEAYWDAVSLGRAAIVPKGPDDLPTLPLTHAGFVRGFDASPYVKSRKSLKVMCRDIRMAVAASTLAKTDAGLTSDGSYEPRNAGVVIGAGIFEHDPEEMSEAFRAAESQPAGFDARKFGSEGMGRLFPLWLLKYLPNMPACHITIEHNLKGPSNTLTADSSGSAAAVEEAARIILRGSADVMFAGGAESRVFGGGLWRYFSEKMLKTGAQGDPVYPVFSPAASGLIMGEGAAILVLEERSRAVARGAKIYAEISGFASAADGGRDRETRGAEYRADVMRAAIEAAGAKPEDVGLVYLSARGIGAEDLEESRAIEQVFAGCGEKPGLVSAKAVTGFMGYADAPAGIALAAMGLREGVPARSLVPEDAYLKDSFGFEGRSRGAGKLVMVNHFESALAFHSLVLKAGGGES
ncbi:MAG: hypothetical protein HQL11_02435 [Candidatus Omnitrophica bacterium]|nr:hypothetical protein [Candidatus Omnitrophota bacterium]